LAKELEEKRIAAEEEAARIAKEKAKKEAEDARLAKELEEKRIEHAKRYDPVPNGDGSCDPVEQEQAEAPPSIKPYKLAYLLSLPYNKLFRIAWGQLGISPKSIQDMGRPKKKTRSGFAKLIDDWIAGGKLKIAVVAKYGEIENWDTSDVTNLACVFKGVTSFNADISQWDVSSVTSLASSTSFLANCW
jgi:surface protein